MAPPGDGAFRALRDPDAFLRAARLLPDVAAWIDPDAALPVSPALPFGQVANTVRQYVTAAGPVLPGLQPIGDALCHTNPSFVGGGGVEVDGRERRPITVTDATPSGGRPVRVSTMWAPRCAAPDVATAPVCSGTRATS